MNSAIGTTRDARFPYSTTRSRQCCFCHESNGAKTSASFRIRDDDRYAEDEN